MRTLLFLLLLFTLCSCGDKQKRIAETKLAFDDGSKKLIELFITRYDDNGNYEVNQDALDVVKLYSTDSCSFYYEKAVKFTRLIAFDFDRESNKYDDYPELGKYEINDRRQLVARMINTLQPLYERFNHLCIDMPGFGYEDEYGIGVIDCFLDICRFDKEQINEIKANNYYDLPDLKKLIEKMQKDVRLVNKETGALEPWLFSPGNYWGDSKIEKDESYLPEDEESEVNILLPARYRGMNLSDFGKMKAEHWYELYKDAKGTFHINRANVHTANFYDDCIGDSVASVFTDRDNSILLINGIEPKDSLPETKFVQESVYTGEDCKFKFHDIKYRLRAEGVLYGEDGDRTNWSNVKNYKVFLSDDKTNQEQLLIAMPAFEGTHVSVLWVGDIDRDGRPDFMFDVSNNYENKSVVLFLSSKAEEGKLVKCVGRSEYNFDC